MSKRDETVAPGVYRQGTKDGILTWRLRVYTKDAKGNKKTLNFTFAGTESEAIKYRQELIQKEKQGINLTAGRRKFKDFSEEWLEKEVVPYKKQNTSDLYKGLTDCHLIPAFGDRHLDAITPLDIEDLYLRLISNKDGAARKDGKPGGLSSSTIANLNAILSSIFKRAVKFGLVDRNPVSVVSKPKVTNKDKGVWTKQEVNLFLEYAKEDRYYVLWRLLLFTGMRIGEALGLRNLDVIDLGDLCSLSVNQIVIKAGKSYVFDVPKTKGSTRNVLVDAETSRLLRDHMLRMVELKNASSQWEDLDLLFPSNVGTPISSRNLNRRNWKNLIKRSGLNNVGIHGLRHIHATLLINSGISLVDVKNRLGHSGINTTMRYLHKDPRKEETFINSIPSFLE